MENKTKFASVVALVASMKANKEEISGDNLGSVIEAACEDLGKTKLNNDDCIALESLGFATAPQIRGKAVSQGYYQKKTAEEKASEHGTSQTRKASIVSAIETSLSARKGAFESLGKAKKDELQSLFDAIVAVSDAQDAERG